MRLKTLLLGLLWVLALVPPILAFDLEPEFLVHGSTVSFILPPELVCDHGVADYKWSEDGRFLLLHQRPPGLTQAHWKDLLAQKLSEDDLVWPSNLIVWERATRRARVAWTSGSRCADVGSFQWLTGGDCAVAVVYYIDDPANPESAVASLISIDTSAARSRELMELPAGHFGDVLASAKAPVAIFRSMISGEDPEQTLYVIKPNGQLGPAVRSPEGMTYQRIECSADESAAYLYFGVPGETESPYELDAATGNLKPIDKDSPTYCQATGKYDLAMESRVVKLPGKSKRDVYSYWLTSFGASGKEELLIASNADVAELSPDANAVLYVSGGAAWVRPILRMPYAAVAPLVEEKARDERNTLSKIVGGALILYCMDNESRLPGKSDDLTALLSRYVDDASILPQFVYEFEGGLWSDIDRPATTPLGHCTGAGGRAVLYADGHVVWEPDGGSGK